MKHGDPFSAHIYISGSAGIILLGVSLAASGPFSGVLAAAGGAGLAWAGAQIHARGRHRAGERVRQEQLRSGERLLRDLRERVQSGRGRLQRAESILRKQAGLLSSGGAQVSEQTVSMERATGQISTWLRDVGLSIEQLSSSTEETSSSVFEMVATIEEIARHIEAVSEEVNQTASSTESLVATIQGVDGNVERLGKFVAETSGTMEQVTNAIRQVESRTADSHDLSDRVAANAEEGKEAVQLTIEGMNRIRGSVSEAAGALTQLGKRSQEIGGILNVIDEVAEQTNLLALNAAIIAAQAGEHGKGFAVVADEIRGLAERTASSTREIGSLIQFFQHETEKSRQHMQDGTRQVEEGSALAERAGEALTKILDSARESSRMAGEIAQTTQEQVQGTQIVVEAVGRVRDMVTQLSAITAEQTARSENIMTTVARMRELTEQVKRATTEQAKGGSLITEAIRSVTDSVASIHQATLKQDTENDRIATALETFRTVGEASVISSREVEDAGRALTEALLGLAGDEPGPVPSP